MPTQHEVVRRLHDGPQMLLTLEDEFGSRVRTTLDTLVRKGEAAYVYHVWGIVADHAYRWIAEVLYDDAFRQMDRGDLHGLTALSEEKRGYLIAKLRRFSTDETMTCPKGYRIYMLPGHVERLKTVFHDDFAQAGVVGFVKEPIQFSRDRLWDAIPANWHSLTQNERDALDQLATKVASELKEDKKRHGPSAFVARRRKGEILPYYYCPPSGEVLSLWAANANRLFEHADELVAVAERFDTDALGQFLFGDED